MATVYRWPSGITVSLRYEQPTRLRTTRQWDGAPGQKVAHAQRSRVQIRGRAHPATAATLDILEDRLRGGAHYIGFWDMFWRRRNGWDGYPAQNSSGAEFWRANGRTSLYAGESDNAPTGPWRTVNATCDGGASADSTSLPVTGLIASEAVPAGAWVRIGDYRHRTLTAATANSSGEATLALASALRAAVAADAVVQIPGDLFVGNMLEWEVGEPDLNDVREFRGLFSEVYSDEVTGGFTWAGL